MKSKDGESGLSRQPEVRDRAFEETGCCERECGGQRTKTKPQ